MQVNVPVDLYTVKRENAAFLIYVENKSSYQIKISYPVSLDRLKLEQYTIFNLFRPGNYKVILTAYAEDPHYPNVYKPVKTLEVPVFLNGYDLVRVKQDTYVGYYLVITDGMLFPNK